MKQHADALPRALLGSLAAAMLASLVLSACGSDDDNTTSSTSAEDAGDAGGHTNAVSTDAADAATHAEAAADTGANAETGAAADTGANAETGASSETGAPAASDGGATQSDAGASTNPSADATPDSATGQDAELVEPDGSVDAHAPGSDGATGLDAAVGTDAANPGSEDASTSAADASSTSETADSAVDAATLSIPAPPADPGFADSADPPSVSAYVDNWATNQQPYRTTECNAALRVLARFTDLWTPMTTFVDAYGAGITTAQATTTCPAGTTVYGSGWTGLPDTGQGAVVNAGVHGKNIQYVVDRTTARTAAEAVAAYMDDRQDQSYSVIKGLGPLTPAWLTGSQAVTTINSVPDDATTTSYSDKGNGLGVGGASNADFGAVIDYLGVFSNYASTEPSKKFFKYPRPFRWSTSVVVAPTLVPVESTNPGTDGGFPSGHTNKGGWTSLAIAYAVPERFQELVTRATELGENRILAGMHSPLDVMGGRILSTAIVAGGLNDAANATAKATGYSLAHSYLESKTGTTSDTLFAYAHSGTTATDAFADYATNKANVLRRLTYGFTAIGDTTKAAVVPKGAEVLLETRLPYLDATQRRVVLKTTELPSGYPLLDDDEGWGRLNLFAAADGYGSFHGNVVIVMDASKGGFFAVDSWRNDISGDGKLTKRGSGTLKLTGANSYTGGTQVEGGTLEGDSTAAFGSGDVYVKGGTVAIHAPAPLTVGGNYTELDGGNLELVLGNGGQGRLVVTQAATFAGGTLHVTFTGGFKPAAGDTINVITSGSRAGTLTTVTVDGFDVTPVYTDHGVQLHIDS